MGLLADLYASELEQLEDEGKVEAYQRLKIARMGENRNGHPWVKVWRGKAKKPYANYVFKNEEHAERWIEAQKAHEDEILRLQADRKADEQKRLDELAERIVVGTILHGSWGYDQTNCEFFQVTERNGKYGVTVREIGHRPVEGTQGFMCESRKPDRDRFVGEPIKKRIGPYGISFDHYTLTPCGDDQAFGCSWYH